MIVSTPAEVNSTQISPSLGENFTALSSRFVMARSSVEASPRIGTGSRRVWKVMFGPRRAARASAASTTSDMSSRSGWRWRWSSRVSATRSPTRAENSPSWAETSSRISERAPSGNIPDLSSATSSSMLVRIDVNGVRSSWPASAINCRCCSREVWRLFNIRLKLRVNSPRSSRP